MIPGDETWPFFKASNFERTRWSLVRRAAFRGAGDGSHLEEFCRIYWYPLYAAARREGLSPEDACDVVQVLFTRLVSKDLIRMASPERGRLRAWLLTLLRHQVVDHVRAQQAQKRGGGQVCYSLDAGQAEALLQAEAALQADPHEAWRRTLACSLLDEAVEALAATFEKTGKSELFNALLPALEGPLPDATYEGVAARLGTTAGALRMAVVRLRERFRRILRMKAAIALGVNDGPQLDQELRELFVAQPP